MLQYTVLDGTGVGAMGWMVLGSLRVGVKIKSMLQSKGRVLA